MLTIATCWYTARGKDACISASQSPLFPQNAYNKWRIAHRTLASRSQFWSVFSAALTSYPFCLGRISYHWLLEHRVSRRLIHESVDSILMKKGWVPEVGEAIHGNHLVLNFELEFLQLIPSASVATAGAQYTHLNDHSLSSADTRSCRNCTHRQLQHIPSRVYRAHLRQFIDYTGDRQQNQDRYPSLSFTSCFGWPRESSLIPSLSIPTSFVFLSTFYIINSSFMSLASRINWNISENHYISRESAIFRKSSGFFNLWYYYRNLFHILIRLPNYSSCPW